MYQFPKLLEFPEIFHAFSTKDEGNMSFVWDKTNTALDNRKSFLTKSGLTVADGVCMHIKNKDECVAVNRADLGRGMSVFKEAPDCDCLMTNVLGINLAMVIADCLPIIIYDQSNHALALVHGHWKTTDKKIVMKAISQMMDKYQSKPAELRVFIGPGITKRNHKLENPLQKQEPDWLGFWEDLPSGETAIDVLGYTTKQLIDAGVQEDNIISTDIDTVEDSNFYSHYRDSRLNPDTEGRFICIVGLKNGNFS